MGDVQVVSLRPFGRAHFGAVSDAINMAARLLASAGASEVLASNSVYQRLTPSYQKVFSPVEPLDARNMGRINAWKTSFQGAAPLGME
jgi:class 3 adenylate cyclase